MLRNRNADLAALAAENAALRAENERLHAQTAPTCNVDALARDASHARHIHTHRWHWHADATRTGECTWTHEYNGAWKHWHDGVTLSCSAPDVPGLGLCWAHAVQAAERTETQA